MLTGILYPTSGQADVLGLVPWRERQKLSFRIASVFGQRSQLWYHLPPADSLDLLARIYDLVGKQHVRQHIRAALMGGARVADVSIEDPPLEEIIAAMYVSAPTA
jgi:ABC-type uncharacterized transport system ATPase subunit